jgi:hypothetical protein
VGNNKKSRIVLAGEDNLGASSMVTAQPSKKDSPRYQALVAAVEAGAIPASALHEMEDEEEEDGAVSEGRDDERTGTRYNVRLPNSKFLLMYVVTDESHSTRGSTSYSLWLRAPANFVSGLHVVCVVAHYGHDQVRAVECNHTRLCQSRAWVSLLYSWMYVEDGNNDAKDEIEYNEELVEGARLAREEPIHEPRERDGECIHARSGSDEDPLPDIRIGVLQASLCPRVGKVDEKDETNEDEDGGSERCDPVTPEDEKSVGDKPGDEYEEQPGNNFRAPPPTQEFQ